MDSASTSTPTSSSVFAQAGSTINAQNQPQPKPQPHPHAHVSRTTTNPDLSPCTLFAIKQYECTATDRVTCWPIERIFRQCKGSPAMEVTNRLVHSGNDGNDGKPVVVPLVDPAFIAHPPRGNAWTDFN